MTDLTIAYDGAALAGDLCIVDGDLALDQGLGSLAVVSLLTDARATAAEAPDSIDDLRGWWGDALSDRPMGSRLWTLARAKTTPDIPRRAEDIAREALAWMKAEGISEGADVTATRINGAGSGATLALQITVRRPTGGPETVIYDLLWEAMR